MEITIIFALPFFLLFAFVVEMRAPLHAWRKLDREFTAIFRNFFPYPKTEESQPTHLDELWANVLKR